MGCPVLVTGKDPISDIERQREAARDKEAPTFSDVSEIVFESHKASLRGDGDRGNWFSPLRTL
jgi:hypothetical protein